MSLDINFWGGVLIGALMLVAFLIGRWSGRREAQRESGERDA